MVYSKALLALSVLVFVGGCTGVVTEVPLATGYITGWENHIIDSSNIHVGSREMYPSIKLDSSGKPHISYYDPDKRDLRYASWTGSEWEIQTVDTSGDVGQFSSLALDSRDNPHISYFDFTNRDLKYARRTGVGWDIETVEHTTAAGYFSSIALDSAGSAHIAFFEKTGEGVLWSEGDLKYAKRTSSGWDVQTVDTEGNTGFFASIDVDSRDNPHIAYFANVEFDKVDLKYARQADSGWEVQTVDSEGRGGTYASLALDSRDNPRVAYQFRRGGKTIGASLNYARRTGSEWEIGVVDDTGWGREPASLALDRNDNPHITYIIGSGGDLKYFWFTGSEWKNQTIPTVAPLLGFDVIGRNAPIAVDKSGNIHVAYFTYTPADGTEVKAILYYIKGKRA